jgi:hypothetical protein
MPAVRFIAMPTTIAGVYQSGAADANGQSPERHISAGDGTPCRHCLTNVAAGEPYLILAYRPFATVQPYAECGPIFLHAEPCERHAETATVPALFLRTDRYLMRGYSADERIVYGTGVVVPSAEMAERAAELFRRPDVAYIHVRSATNNCYQCRIERA